MAKIFYFYGTMKSSKTTNLLMVYHNYEDKDLKPILVKPAEDTRSNQVTSRVGIEEEATYIVQPSKDGQAYYTGGYIAETALEQNVPILLDEAQFFEPAFIRGLCEEVQQPKFKGSNVCIMAYGLLKNFMGKLFEGTTQWLELADDIREIKTVCDYCNHKATYNVLFNDGKVVTQGDTDVVIGDTEYKVVCGNHWQSLREED